MITYQSAVMQVELFSTSDAAVASAFAGPAPEQFEGDGTVRNGRLKVKRRADGKDWWVKENHLDDVTPLLETSLPALEEEEFFDAADRAAQFTSGFRGAGGMNVEYLLLLAWVESRWTNTDSQGRSDANADRAGPIGPFRFATTTWSMLAGDTNYGSLLDGYADLDRAKPSAQCIFAAAYANRLQFALKSRAPSLEAPAWMLRLGHCIGEDSLIRFAQLKNEDSISSTVAGKAAIEEAVIAQNGHLFPRGSQTSRSEVELIIASEFANARAPVEQRLGGLVSAALIEDLANGGRPGLRTGAFGLLDFIAQYESRGSYLKVVDNKEDRLPKKLTMMTIAEVLAAQTQLGGRNACGKYQIVHDTLRGNYARAGHALRDLFNSDAQDKIAYHLLMEVRKGQDFIDSDRSDAKYHTFALAVAQEWAAVPVLTATQGAHIALQRGDSYYRGGNAKNAAGVSPELFESALKKFMAEAPRSHRGTPP